MDVPSPKYSVSVAGVVVREDGRVLVVQRRDNGEWQAPGGVLERWETFAQGVRREIAEETCVDVEVEHLSGVYQNLPVGVVSLVFRCRPTGGAASPTEESRRVEWLTLDEVQDVMAPAFAVRVTDAFLDNATARTHDGVHVISP